MVAIKDMEMPMSCNDCEMTHYTKTITGETCWYCGLSGNNVDLKELSNKRADDCPLIETEQSEDCVSRKAVIDYLHTNMAWYDENGSLADDSDKVRDITNLVNSIPPVKPTHGTCKTCKNKQGSCCNYSSHYLRKDGFCNYFERRE